MILLFFTSTAVAQPVFIKSYGTNQTYSFKANAVCQNYAGGYILAGQRYTPTTGSSDFCVINVNDTGAILWSKTYGGSNDDVAWDIKKTHDNNFIIAGSTKSVSGAFDMYILKTDTAGNILNSKILGGSNLDVAYCIQPTAGSGYVLAGRTQSFGAGNEEFYLIKISDSLTVEWSKTVGNTNPDYASWIEQLPDSSFIACGYTTLNGWDILLTKSDTAGNVVWKKNFGTALDNEYAYCIKPTTDGGYIIAGDQTSAGASVRKALIAKFNSAGAVQWCKTFQAAGFSKVNSAMVQSDGYLFTGYVINGGQADVLLIKTDFNGDTVFTKTIGLATDADYAEKIINTSDGGYAITGYTASVSNYGTDFYLIKTDSLGNLPCNVGNINLTVANLTLASANFGNVASGATSNAFNASTAAIALTDTTFCIFNPTSLIQPGHNTLMATVFPNPFTNHITISLNNATNQAACFIYNATGQLIQKNTLSQPATTIKINPSPAGIYLLKIISPQGVFVKKLIR